MGKNLSSREILQVLVISDHINRKGRGFEIVMPDLEGIEDGKEFLIMSIIVQFGRFKSMGMEGNRVDFTVFSDNGEDGS